MQRTKLSNVSFELYRESDDKRIGTYTTDKDGEIFVEDLKKGEYYWVETLPRAGYVLSAEPIEFTVRGDRTTTLTVTNEKASVPNAFANDHFAYIIGYNDGLVHPEANITRAEVATIFFRLLTDETRNANLTKSNAFDDVNEGDWFNTAVSTMAAMDIVNGYKGLFRPNDPITRAEFAAIAARFDDNGNDTDCSFTDIYEHWGQKEINIAANNGWIIGYEDGTFKPDQYITRAEAMTLVNRVLQRIPEDVDDLLRDMLIWPDNRNTKAWYYIAVQEATNSHDYERKSNGYEYWTKLRETRDWKEFER